MVAVDLEKLKAAILRLAKDERLDSGWEERKSKP